MNLQQLIEISVKQREKNQLKKRVCVCAGAGCISSGSLKVMESIKTCVKEQKLEEKVEIIGTGCMGACNEGPLMKMSPEETLYQRVDEAKASQILESHLKLNKIYPQALFCDHDEKPVVTASEAGFFKKQIKIVLENCGKVNPESIEDAMGHGAYLALHKVLTGMRREQVISEIKESGLRGRGGAGYPTGIKWEHVASFEQEAKYIVCNGDEGDPGAFMDRSVLEGDPHRVLEGMLIAGFAVGAQKGYLYVRAEYPLAIKRFETALKQARNYGLLGTGIFETGFTFDIEIRVGAGAFVCGEETALIASIEGRRGQPRPRPPYPAESGLWGKPTLINNVETFACIAPILTNGSSWFKRVGTPKSAGTKVFALAGKIRQTGLIEVPMGISLKEIIYELGGGIPGNKKFKAAQTGGPSGGCIPEKHLDTKIDYDNLVSLGSIMGSGGLIVMDETSCMVDVARFFMEFCMDESCGKCVPCRVGTKQMHDLLCKITSGSGTLKDLELLEELAPTVKETSLCGLGMTAPNPLLSTLRYFRQEYMEHIVEKKCAANVCQMNGNAVAGGHAS